MPSSQRPEAPPVPDVVDEWVVLMNRWDAAYRDYLAARDARAAGEAASGAPVPELKLSEDEALAALAEIKAEMDKIVAETRQRRRPIGGSMVVGTIGRGEGETSSKAEDDPNKK
ncbi:hypothetical protein ACHMW7_13540 [Aminobacter sp. UC22_36]|uniref:hypothetical protein n=1 Tax=Aminobacter sp. UC22_36 TaxID=3374549 RepID=UPI0037578A6D